MLVAVATLLYGPVVFTPYVCVCLVHLSGLEALKEQGLSLISPPQPLTQ